ncbi:hypothetical protein RII72_003800 [Vibrio parahaemolyticus]|nr:hypothetical protein [Vibrio parahaemolyticus]ELA7519903.1 hypothetical protein [Vibrio parahaemolyticus]ELC0682491.1 hypothetical protein [Vibrio parahaemolyticus]
MPQAVFSYAPKNLRALAVSLEDDLEALCPSTEPHKNKNQRMWCVWWLKNNVHEWSDELITAILDNVCHIEGWASNMDKMFFDNGINDIQKKFFRSTLTALLANAARKKAATLPAHFRFDKGIKDEIFTRSPISVCFPKLALDIWVDSSAKSREKYEGMFTPRLDDLDIKQQSLTVQTNVICRYMICRGIESFSEMTVESFADFRVEHFMHSPTVDLGWKQVCEHLERKGYLPEGWVQQSIDLYATKRPRAIAEYGTDSGVKVSRGGFISNDFGDFESMKQGAQNSELGDVYKQGVKLLYAPCKNESIVSFGQFKMPRKLTDYAIEHINIDKFRLWKTTQQAWVDITDIERFTAKQRANALQYLNAYLFGYLPWFYQKHPNCFFEYPDTPSKFLASAFVKPDPVIDGFYQEQANKIGKELIYPMSLLSFIEGLTENSKNVTTSGNHLRDICSSLRRYFEKTISLYGSIKGVELKSNPIPTLKSVGYKRSGKTKKDTFNVGYWIVFRMWLKEITKAVLFCSSASIEAKTSPEQRRMLRAKRDSLSKIIGFEHINDIQHSENFDSYNIPTSIDIGGKLLEIGQVKYPSWMRYRTRKAVIGDGSTRVDVGCFQEFLLLCVQAYAGQRSSNGAYLCADTFDADYAPTGIEDPATTHVPLRVRTDKVKVQGLESTIQEDVMMLLCYAKELRKSYTAKHFVEPMAYQNNDKSAKGKFRPLLLTTKAYSKYHISMAPFIFMFEEWLRKHDIVHDSKLSLVPSNLSIEDYEVIKEHKLMEATKVMLCEYEGWDELVPYSPLSFKTSITPHSFRVQLVTVVAITTGDRDAVRSFTGQTDGVIGYYTKATPEDAATLTTIKDKMKSSNDVVSVGEAAVTDDMLIQMFDDIENDNRKDLPFFAGSGDALRTLKESGGQELAINHTHICPYDNKCPEEVINEHGRLNCHECAHACITSHHKVAIAAAARKALDEAKEYTAMLMLSTNGSEKSYLEMKFHEQVRIASHWLTRHQFIHQNPDKFVISGGEALEQYQYTSDEDISNSLIAQLRTVNGTPTLQSSHLKRMATVVATKIRTQLQRQQLPELSQDAKMMLEFDPVRYVVHNLNMLAELKGTDAETLLVETMKSDTDIALLEELKLV